MCADEVEQLAAIETLIGQILMRRDEPDFIPDHRVPQTGPGGLVMKKPKKPKKPKVGGPVSDKPLGRWVEDGKPKVKSVRKAPGFGKARKKP